MGNNPSVSGGTRPPTLQEVPKHLIQSLNFELEVPEHAAYEDTSAALGGVGITFIKDSDNNYIVNLLVKWGPAHKCKQIRQGDKLVSIDGLDIQAGGKAGLPLALSGPAGSCTILGFERGVGNPPFFVRLAREEKSYPDMVALAPPGFEFPHDSGENPASPAYSTPAPRSPSPPLWDYAPPPAATAIRWPVQSGPPAQLWQPSVAPPPPTWEYVPTRGQAPLSPRWPSEPPPAPQPQAWEYPAASTPMAGGGAQWPIDHRPAPSQQAWETPRATARMMAGAMPDPQWPVDGRPWLPADHSRGVLVQSREYC